MFQINGGSVITASGSGVSFTCVDYGMGFIQSGLIALSSSPSINLVLGYIGNGVGTYSSPSSLLKTGVFDLSDNLGKEKINVTTSNVTPGSLSTFTLGSGTLKGTFDGTMVDANSGLSLRVSGSFNITQ